jgi:hypothetical protein
LLVIMVSSNQINHKMPRSVGNTLLKRFSMLLLNFKF